jgi:hypothetical protein
MPIDQAFKDIRVIMQRRARTEMKRQEALEHARIQNQFGGEDKNENNIQQIAFWKRQNAKDIKSGYSSAKH